VFVLVQDVGETIASVDVEVGEPVWVGDRFGQRLEWSGVRDALMGSMGVVVHLVCAEGVQEMPLVVDQGSVEKFSTAGPYPPLHDRVHPGGSGAAADGRDPSVGEDRVEQGWVLPVAVADEVAGGRAGVAEVHSEVAGSLGDPGGGWVRGAPSIRTRRVECSITARM
jgi:hypothetical protein